KDSLTPEHVKRAFEQKIRALEEFVQSPRQVQLVENSIRQKEERLGRELSEQERLEIRNEMKNQMTDRYSEARDKVLAALGGDEILNPNQEAKRLIEVYEDLIQQLKKKAGIVGLGDEA